MSGSRTCVWMRGYRTCYHTNDAMSSTSKVLELSVPSTVVQQVESLARREHRTTSELFCEMVRVYQGSRERQDRGEFAWVSNLIAEAKAEQASNQMTADDILAESDRLARAAAQRAKKLGIKTDLRSANRIIHERRKTKRSA